MNFIDEYALFGCSCLVDVAIPEEVTSIGQFSFFGCSKLSNIKIPSKVTSIGQFAFFQCSKLANISIPQSVTSIGEKAFSSCGLERIRIPGSVNSIGAEAFANCNYLESIISLIQEPFNIQENTFPSYKYSSAILYVPQNTRMKYKYVPSWKKFVRIEEMEETYIEGYGCTEVVGPQNYYDLQGQRLVGKANKGMYVNNGRVILVK